MLLLPEVTFYHSIFLLQRGGIHTNLDSAVNPNTDSTMAFSAGKFAILVRPDEVPRPSEIPTVDDPDLSVGKRNEEREYSYRMCFAHTSLLLC